MSRRNGRRWSSVNDKRPNFKVRGEEYYSSESEHKRMVGTSEVEILYPTGYDPSGEETSALEEIYPQPDLHVNMARDIWDGVRADSMTTMASKPRHTRSHSSTEAEQERPALLDEPRPSTYTPLGTQSGSAILEGNVPQLASPLRTQNRQFRRSISEWHERQKHHMKEVQTILRESETNAASLKHLREEYAFAKQQLDTRDQELEAARQKVTELTVELRITKAHMESSAHRAEEVITKFTERVASRVVASEPRDLHLQQALADTERERRIEMRNGGTTLRELIGTGQTSGSDHSHASQALETAPEIKASSDIHCVEHSHPHQEIETSELKKRSTGSILCDLV